MEKIFNILDHKGLSGIDDVQKVLSKAGCRLALIKKLGLNNNDKNQVYFHHNPDLLNSIFDLTFSYRAQSTSRKKKGKVTGSFIPEAVFNHFAWIGIDGSQHLVPHCKGILYLQFPEVRLSGFQADTGLMPYSMSVNYVKLNQKVPRYLVIGTDYEGKAFAVMVVAPSEAFQDEFKKLPFYEDSKICRLISINSDISPSDQLKLLLEQRVAGKNIKGCRLTPEGKTVPFIGTQVHGYTLEHELGIKTNASKDGDIFGIELKCFTSPKLTLFTPEPDGGLYAESFEQFMLKYGYCKETVYRFTGIHRVGSVCERSQLSLEVLCRGKEEEDFEFRSYDPEKPFKNQLRDLQVLLRDSEGNVAASWSMTRLLNNWGVKHNEVVYVPATVKNNSDKAEYDAGFTRETVNNSV